MGKQFAVFVANTPKSEKCDKENIPPPNSPISIKHSASFKKRTPLMDLTKDDSAVSTGDKQQQQSENFVFMDSQLVKERRKKIVHPLSNKMNSNGKASSMRDSKKMVLMR